MQTEILPEPDETIDAPLDPTDTEDDTIPSSDETIPMSDETTAPGAPAEAGGQIPLGGGSGLAIAMAQAQVAEDLARAEEGVLSYGFDLERAWREIEGISSSVDEKRRLCDSAKAEATECKKDYDTEVETLRKRIAALGEERRKPKLAFAGAEALSGTAPQGCAWQRKHGRPCPICKPMLADPALVPGLDSPQHPAHADHEQAVAEVDAKAFGDRLNEAEVFLELPEIQAMDLSAKAVLEQWLNERTVLDAAQASDAEVVHLPYPEAFAKKAHRAGEPDTEAGRGQACTRCGRQLLDDVDIADDGTYPVGAHVGLDCEGAEDIARPVKKRGRTKKNRPTPEAERAEQIHAATTVVDDVEAE